MHFIMTNDAEFPIVPEFSIKEFYFTGIETSWFIINPFPVPIWGTAVIASLIIGMITGTIAWLTD